MVLYVVGLGLGDEADITLRGLKAVQKCDLVFLEAYTSVLAAPKERLETAYGKAITVADRNLVESEAERIYLPAKDKDVAFLVVGDPLCATTHTDIILRAKEVCAWGLWAFMCVYRVDLLVAPEKMYGWPLDPTRPHTNQAGVPVEVVHNASVMGAVASCGLQLYSFGYTVSIPLFEGEWRPDSFYGKIKYNRDGGMHTLCLLDIKVRDEFIGHDSSDTSHTCVPTNSL